LFDTKIVYVSAGFLGLGSKEVKRVRWNRLKKLEDVAAVGNFDQQIDIRGFGMRFENGEVPPFLTDRRLIGVVRPYFETTNGSILVTSCWFFQYASNSAGVR
jgi:hypothetical protein